MSKNAFYAQSGGVTAVINATAAAVIETAKQYPKFINKVLIGQNGILGAIHENLIDAYLESSENISELLHTPGGAFGSCRYKLKDKETDKKIYMRILEVFKAHNIGYFFYNGGNDSQDTTNKIAQISQQMNYPLQCIGIPKTIDNDLEFTDNCPGFGSVAKYVAISTLEASLDVRSMSANSTKVFIMEVMGRHTGWIAASSGLIKKQPEDPPHIILFPEVTFDTANFLKQVKYAVDNFGYCTVVAAEGIKNSQGEFLSKSSLKDNFGHAQLGGVAPVLSSLISSELKYKNHWAVADYLQRAARHIASETDVAQSYALGKNAVKLAVAGKNAIMPIIRRENNEPYIYSIDHVELDKVANAEKTLPKDYISSDGFTITKACYEYLNPLIQGEAYPPYRNGLPKYVTLKNNLVSKKLDEFFI